MTIAGQVEEAVVENEKGGGKKKGKRKDRINPGESRLAFTLIAPTIVLLALIVGYPIVKAIYQSFLTDPGLDAATGLFNEGNAWNAITNYTHWLLQQCATTDGGTASCPQGTLGSQFWGSFGVTLFFTVITVTLETTIGMGFALMMNRAFKGRALVRVAILIPWAIPTAVTSKPLATRYSTTASRRSGSSSTTTIRARSVVSPPLSAESRLGINMMSSLIAIRCFYRPNHGGKTDYRSRRRVW